MMVTGAIGGMKIGRGTEVLHHKSQMTRPGLEPRPQRWEILYLSKFFFIA
jgi:hypothetical protein